MDPQLIKNVLSLPIMILMVLVFLAIIAITITNTIYYKKLWDENGSEAISEESAKTFFFVNLFLAIATGLVFFIFAYRWYKLYNIANMEIALSAPLTLSATTPMRPQMKQSMFSPIPRDNSPKMFSPDKMDMSMICGDMYGGYDNQPSIFNLDAELNL
jgi:magnesium-transporting ATPase (P-type)